MLGIQNTASTLGRFRPTISPRHGVLVPTQNPQVPSNRFTAAGLPSVGVCVNNLGRRLKNKNAWVPAPNMEKLCVSPLNPPVGTPSVSDTRSLWKAC